MAMHAPERLPLAPAPLIPKGEVLIVVGDNIPLSSLFLQDMGAALALPAAQLTWVKLSHWLAANKPSAPVLLGIQIDKGLADFHWHAEHWPLSVAQKRALWNCLCHCYLEHLPPKT
ncbi:hypothetical protein [Oceanisphaera avium]|uniref:hypothetical protein n=1 Tax=Oceanisphaera avium TaxID=1903694 RepID=UPI0012FA0151|nr:hypothetical protein [Oceanisphaera avium]